MKKLSDAARRRFDAAREASKVVKTWPRWKLAGLRLTEKEREEDRLADADEEIEKIFLRICSQQE